MHLDEMRELSSSRYGRSHQNEKRMGEASREARAEKAEAI